MANTNRIFAASRYIIVFLLFCCSQYLLFLRMLWYSDEVIWWGYQFGHLIAFAFGVNAALFWGRKYIQKIGVFLASLMIAYMPYELFVPLLEKLLLDPLGHQDLLSDLTKTLPLSLRIFVELTLYVWVELMLIFGAKQTWERSFIFIKLRQFRYGLS